MWEIIDKTAKASNFEELKESVIEFMIKVTSHTHNIQMPNNDRYNPFANYQETSEPNHE